MADEDSGANPNSSTRRIMKRGLKRPLSRSPVRTPSLSRASHSRSGPGSGCDVRTPSPISIGSVRYRPLSPVYDPDAKVYPPYVMKFPQIFVPAMDETLLWDCPPEGAEHPDDEFVMDCDDSGASSAGRDDSRRQDGVVYTFDSRDTGSFPPRPVEMLVFPPPSRRKRRKCRLEDMDVEEDQMRQPETDVQPAEGTRDEVRAIDAPGNKGRPTKFVLPLEFFDNPDMDLVHPSDLLQAAHGRGERGIKARTRRYENDGRPSWKSCEVVGYDKVTDKYTIEWLSPNGDPTGKTKTVKRLNLILDSESEGNFIARLLAARDLRHRLESQMRYWKFVKSLPFVNPEGVDGQLMIRLMERVGRNLSLKYPQVVKILMEELKDDYHYSVNKAILEFRLRVADEEQRAHFRGLQIFPGPEHSRPPTGKYACAQVTYHPHAPYISKLEEITKRLVIAEEGFLLVLLQFYNDMDVRSSVLVNPEIFTAPRPWGVDDFRLMQDNYARDIADTFRNIWTHRVLNLIHEVLPLGAEILEDPHGKLPRLVSRLSLMMSGQLQHVVLESVNIFKHIWLNYFNPRLSTDGELQPLPIGVRKDPLFKIRLLLQEDHFEFYPKLEYVEAAVKSLLEGIVESVKGMDDLQTRLTDVFPNYASKEMVVVDLDNKQVTAAWDVIQRKVSPSEPKLL